MTTVLVWAGAAPARAEWAGPTTAAGRARTTTAGGPPPPRRTTTGTAWGAESGVGGSDGTGCAMRTTPAVDTGNAET